MAIKSIDHSIRKISIPYDEAIPFTELDERLMANFILLHDQIWNTHLEGRKLLAAYGALSKKIKAQYADLEGLTAALTHVRAVADHILADIRMLQPGAEERYVGAVDNARAVLTDFVPLPQALEAEVHELSSWFEAFIDEVEEEEDPVWDAVSNDAHRLCTDKGNAIDCVGFDREDQDFRGVYAFYRQNNLDYIGYCNDVIHEYNLLLKDINIQYRIWDEFVRRDQLISELIRDYKGDVRIGLN